MAESWLFCRFVEGYPQQAAAFYRSEPGEPPPPPRPKPKTVVAKLKRRFSDKQEQLLFEQVYKTWATMSEGSHPSGIGINQIRDEHDKRGIIGAAYRLDMAQDGFNNGLPAALSLVHEVGRLQPQGGEWEERVRDLLVRYTHLRGTIPSPCPGAATA
jgi:hypothetical protein